MQPAVGVHSHRHSFVFLHVGRLRSLLDKLQQALDAHDAAERETKKGADTKPSALSSRCSLSISVRGASSAHGRGAGPRQGHQQLLRLHPRIPPGPPPRAAAAAVPLCGSVLHGEWGERGTERRGTRRPCPTLPSPARSSPGQPRLLRPGSAQLSHSARRPPGAFKQRALRAVAPPRARGLRCPWCPARVGVGQRIPAGVPHSWGAAGTARG